MLLWHVMPWVPTWCTAILWAARPASLDSSVSPLMVSVILPLTKGCRSGFRRCRPASGSMGNTTRSEAATTTGFMPWNRLIFSVYDTANGFSTVRTVAAPGPRVTDMTFDYTTNTMYALVEDAASWAKIEAGLSETTWLKRMTLHVVDMETGKLIQVGGLRRMDGFGWI